MLRIATFVSTVAALIVVAGQLLCLPRALNLARMHDLLLQLKATYAHDGSLLPSEVRHSAASFGYSYEGVVRPSTDPTETFAQRSTSHVSIGWPAQSFHAIYPTRQSAKTLASSLRPLWLGIALDTLCSCAVVALAIFAIGSVRTHVRRARSQCPACGYPTGSSQACTECGFLLAPRTSHLTIRWSCRAR